MDERVLFGTCFVWVEVYLGGVWKGKLYISI